MVVRVPWVRKNVWTLCDKHSYTTIISPSNHAPPVRLELARYWELLQENIRVQLELFRESWVNWACTGRRSVDVCIELREVQLRLICMKSLDFYSFYWIIPTALSTPVFPTLIPLPLPNIFSSSILLLPLCLYGNQRQS